jgi:hypothetical protein
MPLVRNSQNPQGVNVTDEAFVQGSNFAALKYLEEHGDVRQDAVAKTLARGITPDNPEYSTVLANYGKEHFSRYGRFEDRGGLGASAFKQNAGYYDVGQADAVGAAAQFVYQGSTASDFINTVPRVNEFEGAQPPGVIPTPDGSGFQFPDTSDEGGTTGGGTTGGTTGGGTTGGGTTGGTTGGGTTGGGTTGGTTGGGTTGGGTTGGTTGGTDTEDGDEDEGPTVDLSPVLTQLSNLQGQVTALQNQPSSSSTSLMSPTVVGTATPSTDLSPVTDDISDVQTDTTAIRGDIGTRAEGQPATLMGQTAGLAQGQTDITGRIGTAPTPDATLFGGQAGLAQDLTTAQQGITGIQAGIGEAPVDPTTGDPTTLFQGQAGLMSGQTGLSTAISGVGSQASAIGSDLTALTNQLTNFENLSNADRANLLSTLNTRATELKDLANTYGLQTNRIAEQLTGVPAPTGMMAQVAPVAGSLPAVLAAERAQNTATQNINRGLMDVAEQGQVGALGPVAVDPRVG